MSPRKPTKARKELGRYGQRGARTRVVVERGLVRVLWTEAGTRRAWSLDDDADNRRRAHAFAEETAARLATGGAPPPAPLSVRELWEAYWNAHEDAWRSTTGVNARNRWALFELAVDRGTRADLITPERLDVWKRDLLRTPRKKTRKPMAPQQVQACIGLVKRVYRFGVLRRLIPATTLVLEYRAKISRDTKGATLVEYTRDEADAILRQWNPRDSRQWRMWVLTTLLAYCGPRQTAARALEWRDIDFAAGTIHWRPELDKVAKERWQPMPAPVVEALWVAYGWRLWAGYTGPFVFFAPQGRTQAAKPWSYSAYNQALHAAERAAGIPERKYNAAHAFRRLVVGDVYEQMGNDVRAAADYIGDTPAVVLRHYVKPRRDQLTEAAKRIGGTVAAANRTQTAPAPENDDAAPAHTETASTDGATTYED